MGSPSAVLTLGLGSWSSVNELVTLGYGAGVAIPGGPSLQYTLPITKAHYTLLLEPLHYTLPLAPLHYTLPDDDKQK